MAVTVRVALVFCLFVVATTSLTRVYRPRQPRASLLGQPLDRHFDEFERVFNACYQKRYGLWRPMIARSAHRFLACGDLNEGFARSRCQTLTGGGSVGGGKATERSPNHLAHTRCRHPFSANPGRRPDSSELSVSVRISRASRLQVFRLQSPRELLKFAPRA